MRILPPWWNTWWFRSICAGTALCIVWKAYQYRLAQIDKQIHIRIEERVNERTRIARELHDTLLQSFQGTLLKFHALTYMLGDRPEAQKVLEGTIEQARQAVAEGRDAVQGLRSSTVVGNDLVRAIGTLGEGLAADHAGQNCPEFRVYVEGKSMDVPSLVREEVYRITNEALRHAFRHAQAKRIEVKIRYEDRQFRLQVRETERVLTKPF